MVNTALALFTARQSYAATAPSEAPARMVSSASAASLPAAPRRRSSGSGGMVCAEPVNQGLALVHFSAQHEHILWNMLGAWFSPSLLDRGTQGGVTKTA